MSRITSIVAATLVGCNALALAGNMGPNCVVGNVALPCEQTAWEFAGYALYLKPSFSGDNEYVGYTQSTTSSGGLAKKFQPAQRHWEWGFKIETSYHFNTGNDINLNWSHLSINNDYLFRSLLTGNDEVLSLGMPRLTVQPRWNAVNLEFGQLTNFSPHYRIRFHGDLSYYGETKITTVTANKINGVNAGTTDSYLSSNKYNSIGPRLGADLSYDWGNGLGIYANGATALFTGTRSNNTSYVAITGVTNTLTGSVVAIVPECEIKLGATYTRFVEQGDLSLDLGWMWINYFHGDVAAGDFGLQGLYVGLKWLGNVI